MNKYPIRIPKGWRLTITQGYHANHEANDVTSGDGPSTYGLPVVWSFPFPGKPYRMMVNSPLAAKATRASAQIDGIDPNTGITYSCIYIHLSSAPYVVEDGVSNSIVFKQGDIVGYIGNSGAVIPKPTPTNPFGGAHLHLALGIKKPGEANFTMVDPLLHFDILNPFRGADDPSRDKPVYDWAADQAILPSDKLTFLGQSMTASNPTQAKIVLAVAAFLRAFNS